MTDRDRIISRLPPPPIPSISSSGGVQVYRIINGLLVFGFEIRRKQQKMRHLKGFAHSIRIPGATSSPKSLTWKLTRPVRASYKPQIWVAGQELVTPILIRVRADVD
ncbi:hypothetical protein OUZ56_002729 [Daphnia magna]|uniref:Uncharacterized protein n=1 Tax=Daphnia magna TaxID=35525 RepID=A0ABR0A6K8_9CRUS|nr:hypothetical protein OUZ56_002729 [Daphnia magna]